MQRVCFLSHFVICLACAALAFFAWQSGALLMVWQNDASMMTSVIAVLFVGTAVWLGWQAWNVDRLRPVGVFGGAESTASADFGHEAKVLCTSLGMLGTTVGLSLQAKALMNGSASFGALSTALFTTACGMAGFIMISLMVLNLEAGIKRARR